MEVRTKREKKLGWNKKKKRLIKLVEPYMEKIEKH